MLLGEPTIVDQRQLKLLPRWCVKTAATLEMFVAAHGQEPMMPEWHRRYVHARGAAPPNVTVSVATYGPVEPRGMVQFRRAGIGPDPRLPLRSRRWAIPCYATTILLGHFMFQVVGPVDPEMDDWGVIGVFPFRSVQIWPSWRPAGGVDANTHPAPPGHFPPEFPSDRLPWPTSGSAQSFQSMTWAAVGASYGLDGTLDPPPPPPEKAREDEVGRNEPCPCGSGLKYKRCHGV
jgi:hypothetical protein